MSGIFPPSYRAASGGDRDSGSDSKKECYYEFKQLTHGESIQLRLCGTYSTGHVIAGYSYFTEAGKPRRFPEYPENYLDDIGFTYEGKKNGTGERDRPRYFLSWACLIKGELGPRVLTITQKGIREQIEAIFAEEDFGITEAGVSNFYLKVTRQGEGTDTTYTVIPITKPPTDAEVDIWQDSAEELWLPALYEGGDPFAGKPSTGRASLRGIPPTSRDGYGADEEITPAEEEEDTAPAPAARRRTTRAMAGSGAWK